ncbi:acyl carrier protein [Micromonospora sp. DT227]|uniref:acyl carrier protein n=1 Tax=Micromonospora sp. DT227 TaxID=3393433 RepID=UPI003CEF9C79
MTQRPPDTSELLPSAHDVGPFRSAGGPAGSAATTAALAALLTCATEALRRPVTTEDHFLDLGGDSLVALRLVARLREHGFELDVEDLYEQPDMVSLARYLTGDDARD